MRKYRKKFRNQNSIVIFIQKEKQKTEKYIDNSNINNLYVERNAKIAKIDLWYVKINAEIMFV